MCMTPAIPRGPTGDPAPKVMSLVELRQHPRPQELPPATVWCICEVCGLRIQPVFHTPRPRSGYAIGNYGGKSFF